MEIVNYDTLLEKHLGLSFEKQYNLAEVIGENDWAIDMDTQLISFGEGLDFPMQILGTYAFDSATWLWAWANEASQIPKDLLMDAHTLKEYGEKNNIEFLTKPEYKMEQEDVHSLGMIVSGFAKASAYYAANYGDGVILVTLMSKAIDNIEYNEQERIIAVIPNIVSNFAVNHKRTIQNYLTAKAYFSTMDNNTLIATKENNIINIEFDEADRMASLNGEIKA